MIAKPKATGKPPGMSDQLFDLINKNTPGGGLSKDFIDSAFWQTLPPTSADWAWLEALDWLDQLGDAGPLGQLLKSFEPSPKIEKYIKDFIKRSLARGTGRRKTPDYTFSRNDALLLIADECVSEMPKVVDLHWHGKFRGPDFSPIGFMLQPGTSERIKDSKGRSIWTVTARVLSAAEKAAAEDRGQEKQDRLLSAMKAHDGASLIELAKFCGWYYKNGDPNKSLVERTMHDLEGRRLVKKEGGHWKLTKAGMATDTESL